MKYIFIMLSLLACSETTTRATEEETDYQDCDYACEFAELSYYCHKDVLELDIRYMPDYEELYYTQTDECKQSLIEVLDMQYNDDYDDLAICWRWEDWTASRCDFEI